MLLMLKTGLHFSGVIILLGEKTAKPLMVMAIIGTLKWQTLLFLENALMMVRRV